MPDVSVHLIRAERRVRATVYVVRFRLGIVRASVCPLTYLQRLHRYIHIASSKLSALIRSHRSTDNIYISLSGPFDPSPNPQALTWP